jgi:hypothetical protein
LIVFRRRREGDRPDESVADSTDVQEVEEVEQAHETEDFAAEPAGVDEAAAASGPWDIADVADPGDPSGGGRIDLGGMWLPGREGMEIRIDVDEKAQRIVAATVVVGESALQLQPYAAPRSEGIWREVRGELADGIVAGGGTADEVDGSFGREIRAEIPVQAPDGRTGVQRIRFIGFDGPRWFLRGAISGKAYDDAEAAAVLEAVFRDVVVVRGGEPMAPREPLPLRLPVETPPDEEGGAPRTSSDLNPFTRGPEITEIQ